MLILRTADNLRHIRGLGEVFPSAADTAAEAVQLLQDKLHERIAYILNEKLKDDE